MKTIMLACAAGMSTSMLVTKMQEAARNQDLKPISLLYPLMKQKHV